MKPTWIMENNLQLKVNWLQMFSTFIEQLHSNTYLSVWLNSLASQIDDKNDHHRWWRELLYIPHEGIKEGKKRKRKKGRKKTRKEGKISGTEGRRRRKWREREREMIGWKYRGKRKKKFSVWHSSSSFEYIVFLNYFWK